MLILQVFCPLVVAVFSFASQSPPAQSTPIGTWLTIDDETGEAKSHIQIFEKDGKQFGKITKVMRSSLNHLCDQCEGERKNQPVLGMVIIEDMALKKGYWQGGRVLVPREGKWYRLNYWLKPGDSDRLVVRGYMGLFYRTQEWQRVR